MMDIEFENQLRTIARETDYPRTPDIAGSVMARLLSLPSHTGIGDRVRDVLASFPNV